MKLGIIIVFNSFENSFPKEALIEKINSLNDVCICLVNNKSNANTENYLNEISENCKNTSVVNIKMSKYLNYPIPDKNCSKLEAVQFEMHLNHTSLVAYSRFWLKEKIEVGKDAKRPCVMLEFFEKALIEQIEQVNEHMNRIDLMQDVIESTRCSDKETANLDNSIQP